MRDASTSTTDEPSRSGFTCQACQRFIVTAVEGLFTNPHRGSPQRFCSPACRQAAYRRRNADVAEDHPRQHTGGRNRRLKTDDQPPKGSTFNRRQGVNFQPPLTTRTFLLVS
jgi:hypothetical protein